GSVVATPAPNNTYQIASGTSVAAPGIAGCLAQLTQAFKTLHNGQEAPAALLKTLILNSANDLGNVGPDFKYGWGHINANRALRLIEAAQWSENTIDNDETNTKILEIPAGVRQAKVMLYWAEAPAAVVASKALINDLDLRLTNENGNLFLPWILDPTPDPVTLNAPAIKGRDSLNNVEQVSITDPAAGTYTITISGTEVPMGPQAYFLAWEFLTDSITITYPNGGEGFVPGETERIHWDAHGVAENFVLRYSTDNGDNWLTMTTVAGSLRQYDWLVPNAVSGKVLVQIQRGAQNDTSNALFSIAPVPQNIEITQVCPDSMRISWTDLQDTLAYDVYLLGAQYMELAGSTESSSIALPIENPHLEKWVSVRCTAESGLAGRRAIAVQWQGGLKNCPLSDDLALNNGLTLENDTLISCTGFDYPITVEVKNAGSAVISNATIQYQVNNLDVISEPLPDIAPGISYPYIFQNTLELADNQSVTIKIWTSYPADEYRYNDTLSFTLLYITQPAETAFSENFEASEALPNGWVIKNPDAALDGIPWVLTSEGITGANGAPTRALFLDCFSYLDAGEEDYVYLRPLDLSNFSNPGLSFYIAHARYNSSSVERLRLEVFPDCNPDATPVVVWQKSDPVLATVPDITSEYKPLQAEDWRREYVNLQQFAGQSVFLRFASVNDYGNSIYLDNINFEQFEVPEAAFSVSADSICRNDTIYYQAVPSGSGSINYVWNFGTGASPIAANGPGPHAVRYLLAGSKIPRLIAGNPFVADTATAQVYVRPFPISGFTVASNELTVNFTNTSQNASSYFWTFGDGNTSTETNPEHIYGSPGNYVVKLSATNACTTVDKTSIVILTTGTSDLADKLRILILPNPTAGDFRVELERQEAGPIRLTLLDVQGRLVKTAETIVRQSVTTVPFENLGLAKGAYQLNVQTEQDFRTFSIIVQ
ncbi:MAG: PKD domain-containing protein, partial [Saprospiraceae bacterium]|nr:PKD domain-containing protein [Saprospiraceae bacterium]